MRRAFSLIELLVVISIIALLIAILLPALGSARASARSVQCLSNARQLSTAVYTFAADNDGAIVGGYIRNGAGAEGPQWAVAYEDYYGDSDDVLRCPEAPRPKITGGPGTPGYYDQQGTATSSWTLVETQYDKFTDPNRLYEGGYAINGWTDGAPPLRPFPEYVMVSFDDIANAADLVLFADASRRAAWPLDTDPNPEPMQSVSNINVDLNRYAVDRHNQNINAAMFDGSGRLVAIRNLKDEVKFYEGWGE